MKSLSRKAGTAAAVAAGLALAACGSTSTPATSSSGGGGSTPTAATATGPVGIDFPRSDSEFWNAYIKDVPIQASAAGLVTLTPTQANNNAQTEIANVQSLLGEGAKGLLIAPQDDSSIVPTLAQAASSNIPVVAADTAPASGKWYMVVRGDNIAMGTEACKYMGTKLNGKGNVAMLEGDPTNVNGADRTTGFKNCMSQNFPNIKLYEAPAKWDGPTGAADLQTFETQTSDGINGVYMESSGFLLPTVNLLRSDNLLKPPSDPKHVVVVDVDGVNADLVQIKAGNIDATVSQPVDGYAKYGIQYLKDALAGKTQSLGPDGHGGTIVTVNGGLEDQLPSPLVTIDGATYGGQASTIYTDTSLWGNAAS